MAQFFLLGHMKSQHLFLFAVVFLMTGCESFFRVRGTVTDYRTGAPIAGAKATLVLDRGAGEEDHSEVTDSTGRIGFWMNEPQSVWATLTVTKTNYDIWSTQFRGAPRSEIRIRLVPVGEASGVK